jgi:hypothetical protein
MVDESRMAIIRNAIIILLFCGFLASVLLFGWAHFFYASNLPAAPDEREGRVCRMIVNHGSVRYGTEGELHTLRFSEDFLPMGLVFLAMGIVLIIRYKRHKQV